MNCIWIDIIRYLLIDGKVLQGQQSAFGFVCSHWNDTWIYIGSRSHHEHSHLIEASHSLDESHKIQHTKNPSVGHYTLGCGIGLERCCKLCIQGLVDDTQTQTCPIQKVAYLIYYPNMEGLFQHRRTIPTRKDYPHSVYLTCKVYKYEIPLHVIVLVRSRCPIRTQTGDDTSGLNSLVRGD